MKSAEEVVVLTCSHSSEYYSSGVQNEEDTIVRALKTNDYNHRVLSKILEQPNSLKGVPAASEYCNFIFVNKFSL